VVVVPDGVLGLVPFALLSTGGGAPTRYAFRHAPSLAGLAEAEARPHQLTGAKARGAAVLVVADPSMPVVAVTADRREALPPLAGARREGEWVAARFGAPLLAGATATETVVRASMASAPLIHLATHGFAYGTDARARDSFIALAPDGSNDGLLTVGELLDDPALRLQAELVVLSACQTGLGNLRRAEGIVGLQRAFLAKGARSVLVSLWSVDDAATRLLMERFYTHWLDDADHPTKAHALRRAQTDLRTAGYSDARFWAAFQLVGAS
jgi:CHAT domain-containing protein